MSERILRALMQLFAIVAKVDEVSFDDNSDESLSIQSTKGKEIIEAYLKSELSSADVNKYLKIFDDFLNTTRGKLYSKSGGEKRTSLQSVKVLRICEQINKELTQRQKFLVLIRIIEFINADNIKTEREIEFVNTVADSFHIEHDDFNQISRFIDSNKDEIVDEKNHVYYTDSKDLELEKGISAYAEGLDAPIHAIFVPTIKAIFFKYYGLDELYINGQIVANDKTHVFNVGSTVRTTKSSQIFYSDIVSKVNKVEDHQRISFKMNNVIHSFKSGKEAVRKLSFSTNEGKLIGIMGGSGTGKTTLLNIMNGKMEPTFGSVEINGINLHENPELLEGIIGNVSQDDILIEELTVFENLFYGARLCMGHLTDQQLAKKVIEVLKSLGLYEARRLKVGSVLEKVISGGQRKRLNIALELIREPAVLFVDEPTSGLSSRDSENIMDLLKELSLNGKLVFVVIHQPSSNIFKLFDRLIIMDVGGYPIYDGIPLNAVAHFKTFSFHGNSHERECSLCGNVNPEQIFNIIDAKIVDEYGNETNYRKREPKDWHELYLRHKNKYNTDLIDKPPQVRAKLPSRMRQFMTYLKRDTLSKISNMQYVMVNLLVAPALALVLSFFIKYFDWARGIDDYIFFKNQNIPQYVFISVIVAIFLGLTVAAEEINKDKKILAREKFLNLSRNSYLGSKVLIMFTISAIQSLSFVLIGNLILEVPGMWWQYWLILFSTSCVSNLAGLNISSAFNSAKVIYIIVPLLIIPQLLFSGVIVKFDKLHPSLSASTKVPWVGEMMVSRWAYEAITVEQQTNNSLEKNYFVHKAAKSKATWKKDFWVPEMETNVTTMIDPSSSEKAKENARLLLINEIEKEDARISGLDCYNCIEDLKNKEMDSDADFKAIWGFLDTLHMHFNSTANKMNDSIQSFIDKLGPDKYKELKMRITNEALEDLLTNRLEENKILTIDHEIYQNDDPVYNDPTDKAFFETHFYAPYKYPFGLKVRTYWANLVFIWLLSVISYFVLYYDLLKAIMDKGATIINRLKIKKTPIIR